MATTNIITATPSDSVSSGLYRIVLKEDAFGTDKPNEDIYTAAINVGQPQTGPTAPTPTTPTPTTPTPDTPGTPAPDTGAELSDRTEAGAFLMEVNLRTNRCSVIKQWPYITIAGRSLTAHNGRLYWFEGSHYGNRSRGPDGGSEPDEDGNLPVNYAATVGNVFSLSPGTRNIRNHGVNWRSQFEYPDDSQVVDDYGFHTQTASPMRSDGENLYLISGFGGLQTINSPNYATSRRGPQGVDPVTDIGNWQLIKYGQDIERRIWLFDGNGKKGWDAIRELATLTNSFIGLDKHGLFYFESKGGLRAKVQNSAPGSIEFRDPTDIFPQKGLIEINGELITYDGIIGRQFLNVDRAQYGTNQATHCSGSPIRLIKAVLNDGQKVFEPVQDADIRSNTKQLYNKIIITYDGGTFKYQDNASILRYGEKVYNMTIPLTVQQTDWIEEVSRRFIENHKEIHYLITLKMIEDLSLQVTDVVFLKIPQRARVNQACQIYQATQNPITRRSELVLRTL